MSGKRCFFVGHRETPDALLPAIQCAVEKVITEYGVNEFVVGHYGNFDRLAASAVIAAKRNHPGVSLLMLLPYHPSESPVTLLNGFDGTYYPTGMETVPRRYAIIKANRHAVDNADCLIAYAVHTASNARKLLEYAYRREKKRLVSVLNIKPCAHNEFNCFCTK